MNQFKQNFRESLTSYMLAAFGFVAGLAWNEAIQALVSALFPLGKDAVWAKFLYAIIITALVVVVSAILIKLSGKKDEKKKE
ncbi:MAG: DUF5654 family protein [Candidatus Uhrbacteria bacterium]